MDINYRLFNKWLPHEECLISKRQRQHVWDKWDTNLNGILSLKQIEQGLLQLFNLQQSEEMRLIINQCAEETKKRFNIGGKYGPNHIQKREFRGFLQHMHKHIKSLMLFQTIAKDKQMGASELISATNSLINHDLDEQDQIRARKFSNQTKITFNAFERWLKSLNFYVSRQTRV